MFWGARQKASSPLSAPENERASESRPEGGDDIFNSDSFWNTSPPTFFQIYAVLNRTRNVRGSWCRDYLSTGYRSGMEFERTVPPTPSCPLLWLMGVLTAVCSLFHPRFLPRLVNPLLSYPIPIFHSSYDLFPVPINTMVSPFFLNTPCSPVTAFLYKYSRLILSHLNNQKNGSPTFSPSSSRHRTIRCNSHSWCLLYDQTFLSPSPPQRRWPHIY